MAAESAHKWAEVFISGDLDEFDCENRGGKHSAEFYDFFPELEEAAKQYTLEKCSEKAASFTADDLAKFIDLKFYETTNLIKGELLAQKFWHARNVSEYNFCRTWESINSFVTCVSA